MLSTLKDIISGLAAFFRMKEKADDRANSPEMIANANAKRDAEIKDTANAAVRETDLEKIRRLAAE